MTDITLTGRTRSLLHDALRLDAAVTGANGLAYLVAAQPLGDLLGLEPALLRGVGGFLLAFALLVAVAMRRPAPRLVGTIVALNALWAAESLVAAGLGWGSPTTAGSVWIVAQATVVGAFAVLQLTALRRGEEV